MSNEEALLCDIGFTDVPVPDRVTGLRFKTETLLMELRHECSVEFPACTD